MIDADFAKYNSVCVLKPNYMLIPVTNFSFKETDVAEFNEIYKFCLENIEKKITWTNSHGISISDRNIRGDQFGIKTTSSMFEITLKRNSQWYRFQMRNVPKKKENESRMYGRESWTIFKNLCKKYDIKPSKSYISREEGIEEKTLIVEPMIRLGREDYANQVFENAHHLDFNSSYAYGIIQAAPEFEKPIRELFEKRKEHPEYKQVLAHLHGVMQSSIVNYRLSHIARFANADNRNRLINIARKLRRHGNTIIMYNTDGIWYTGDVYHDENEGTDIGQWKNDHINCKFRAKSKGAYEFIENGKYHPVFRGRSSYDDVVPREEWVWGDIYKGGAIKYVFREGVGLVLNDGENE